MTGGDANKAEVQIDMTGDAIEQVKELAKELDKAADAQEELTKRAERYQRVTSTLARQRVREEERAAREQERAERQRSHVLSSLTRQRVQQEQQHEERRARVASSLASQRVREEARAAREAEVTAARQARVQSGLARQRFLEEERAVRERRSRPLTEMQEAGRRILAGEREERVQRMMGRLAPKSGLAGLAQRAEGAIGLKLGSLSGLAGRVGSMGGPAAGIGMMMAAGKYVADVGVTISDQMQHGNPYADDFTRGREQMANAPFAREFFAASDLVTGRAAGIKRENRRRIEEDSEARIRYQQFEAEAEQRRQERAARMNTRVVRDIPLPRMESTARSTVSERRQYQLAQRLLPLEERRAEAARAAAEATNEQTANLERLKVQEQRLADLRQRKADIEGRFQGQSDGSPAYIGALGDLSRIGREIREAEQSQMSLRERVRSSTLSAASARYQMAQAGVGVTAGRLEDLRRREDVAETQATLLGYTDRSERAMAAHWKRVVNQTKRLSDLPPEGIASVQKFFPEEAREIAEREGQVYASEFRQLGPRDYRDDLPVIRKQVDAAEQQVRSEKETSAQDYKNSIAEGIRSGGLPDGRELGRELAAQFKRMIQDAKDQLIYEMMLGAYNLPGSG